MVTNPPLAVHAPETAEYVLPSPPRNVGDVVVVAPRRDAGRAWRRGAQVAQALGERFLLLAESQQIFAEELRGRLVELDQSIAEATKAQLKGAVRDLLAVLAWSDTVVTDLAGTSRLAAGGAEPIDVLDLCQEVADDLQAEGPPIHVTGADRVVWWGQAAGLAEAVRFALVLVAERTAAAGARLVEVVPAEGAIEVHIKAAGEPVDQVDAGTATRFRQAVEQLGARVRPGALGPGGAALVLELPPAAAG